MDSISPPSPETSAFDHLVLEPKKKDLLYSLVESHRNFVSLIDDVISGKGAEASRPPAEAVAHSESQVKD